MKHQRQKPEAILAAAGTQFLQYDGWRALKMETIGKPEWGKGFGEPGMPDYLYLRYQEPLVVMPAARPMAEVLWIEWKSLSGSVKQHQTDWHVSERKRGAWIWCAKIDFAPTVDGFTMFYKASGLNRRIL